MRRTGFTGWNVMNKTNWDEAPEWANYHATNYDGFSYWYKYEPVAVFYTKEWTPDNALCKKASPLNVKNWEFSLQSRMECDIK